MYILLQQIAEKYLSAHGLLSNLMQRMSYKRDEIIITSVTVAMHAEVGGTVERLAADRAHEWLVIAMQSLVADQVSVC